jgi:hypothetical protein
LVLAIFYIVITFPFRTHVGAGNPSVFR